MTSVAPLRFATCSARPTQLNRAIIRQQAGVPQRRAGLSVVSTNSRRPASLLIRAKSSTAEEPTTASPEEAVRDSTAADGSEKKKYYRTVPGFPGMMVEFDEPEKKRVRGEVVWWKVLLLTMGVGLMFSQATVLVSLFMRR
eukprot:CAMPEP_0177757832 /NCGR_PEP_ID=MMETSP0491_2-20121128/3850_1 /TAXON_ID=63592 /ORGANISM="Tetraselmis chuii, Strain PLY429" /LENGTH=140 /DNA_ID=CAMNT_0019273503 /DNA_START=203 /DNA_END=625 /DNA_ORIENTATION=+